MVRCLFFFVHKGALYSYLLIQKALKCVRFCLCILDILEKLMYVQKLALVCKL